jgi:hypothetical protein
MNYRAFKYNFTSNPTDAPALYTYAHNTSAPTSFWMSWNGATKVVDWRIYSSPSRSGPWTVVTTVKKAGFETEFTSATYHAWSIVESLDADGNALKNSTRPIRTFVPSAALAAKCDSSQCPSAKGYASPAASSSTAAHNQKRNGITGELGFAAVVGMGAMMA